MNKLSSSIVSLMTTLLVSPLEKDHATLKGFFSRSNWCLRSAFSRGEALALSRRELIPVVICVEDLPDGNWKRLLDELAQTTNPSRLIVSSRMTNNHLWAEVLQAGAYDFLPMPWEAKEVLKLNSLAWHSWSFACRSTNVNPTPTGETRILARAAAAGLSSPHPDEAIESADYKLEIRRKENVYAR